MYHRKQEVNHDCLERCHSCSAETNNEGADQPNRQSENNREAYTHNLCLVHFFVFLNFLISQDKVFRQTQMSSKKRKCVTVKQEAPVRGVLIVCLFFFDFITQSQSPRAGDVS